MNLIEKLSEKSLCYQCGTCVSACNNDCIKMVRNEDTGIILPKIENKERCIDCKLCEKACPLLNVELPERQFETISIGLYKSLDEKIYINSSSGGVVSGVLKYLLDNKVIDRALVSGVDGVYAKAFWIKDSSELKNIQGSKYQPVALNELLGQVKHGEKIAVIGLPCHILGVDRLMNQSVKLRKSVILKIGIFCTIGRGMNATKVILGDKMTKNDGKNIRYRDTTYPGNMVLEDRDKVEVLATHKTFLDKGDYLFYPKGCHFCNDLYNVKADISVGDSWGLDKGKVALVLVRTGIGAKIVKNAVLAKDLESVDSVTVEEAIKTQEHSYKFKILNYEKRYRLCKSILRELPINLSINDSLKVNFKYRMAIRLLLLNSTLFNSNFGVSIVRNKYICKITRKYRNFILRNGV